MNSCRLCFQETGDQLSPDGLPFLDHTSRQSNLITDDVENIGDPPLLSHIRKAVRDQALEYTASRVSIEVGQLGAEAVALGTCTLVVDELLANGGVPPVLGQNKYQPLRLP